MDTVNIHNPNLLLAVLVVIVLVAVGAWLFYQKQQTKRLEQRFGPEYGRTLRTLGNQGKAEAELRAREHRVQKLNIVPLPPADVERFRNSWTALQRRFVETPKGVLADADLLVRELMTKRGYPMVDFEHRAADISVDHGDVVGNYRAAQAIAARDQRGEADTEQLRQGVLHYRALFEKLLVADQDPVTPINVENARMQS